MARVLRGVQLAALAFVLLAGCAGTQTALVPPGSVASAWQSYGADVSSCQRVRDSRLSTLGPTIFQPISGDEPFNECVTRAKASLDLTMPELE